MNKLFKICSLLSFLLLGVSQLNAQCKKGDCVNGIGIYVYKSGTRYEGSFKGGQRNGVGTCFFANGDRYEGEWLGDFPEGKGVRIYADGTRQEGLWEKGKLVSQIRSVNKEDSYSLGGAACLSGNCVTGKGVYKYPNGDIYEGDFVEAKRQGYGIYYYVNGDRYEGEFANHQFQGKGSVYYKSGSILNGIWAGGQFLRKSDDAVIKTEMKIWAVVVGVAKYNPEAAPPLNFSDDDAYQFYAFLKSPEGGALPDEQVKILIDERATRQNIINTMREEFEKADTSDLIILYFAGHGVEGSFIPADYDGENNELEYEFMNQILQDSKAKYKLCIADACHSGSLTDVASAPASRNYKSRPVNETIQRFYAAFSDIRGGLALILSSKSEEYSLEANGLRQGLFSHFLIRGMKGEADTNDNKIVSVSELYDYIKTNVNEKSKGNQSPILSGDFDKNMPVSSVRK